jgi:hypothetical protein
MPGLKVSFIEQGIIKHTLYISKFVFWTSLSFFWFLAALGFELRPSCLLGKLSYRMNYSTSPDFALVRWINFMYFVNMRNKKSLM